MSFDESKGWVKVNRKLLSWRWYQDANTFRVFLHLLLSANVSDHDFQNITIHRGEVATSYESIARSLGLSMQNVRTAINHLKTTGEVTSRTYPKFQVISIVSWDFYQCELTGKPTGNQQAANRQLTPIKEVKNGKKDISSSSLFGESTDKPKKLFSHEENPYRAALWLSNSIHDRLPTCKPKTEAELQRWAADFDKCNRLDGHPWEEINGVLVFSQSDMFWKNNILSASKFRKQYVTLLAKMGGNNHAG